MIHCKEVAAPAYWASYLINGDASGLDDAERALCDAWREKQRPWYVVGMASEDWGDADYILHLPA